MANPWFKFYGGDYLNDPKIFGLSLAERSCWITLLCLASTSSEPGKIFHLTEQQLMLLSGVTPDKHMQWKETAGIISKLKDLKMIDTINNHIEIVNWKKRQGSYITEAERKALQRAKTREDGGVQTNVRQPVQTNVQGDKNRIDKSIVSKADSPHHRIFEFFVLEVKRQYGTPVAINGAKDGKLVSSALKKYGEEKVKKIIEYYLQSKKADEFGTNLSVALSTHSINMYFKDNESLV